MTRLVALTPLVALALTACGNDKTPAASVPPTVSPGWLQVSATSVFAAPRSPTVQQRLMTGALTETTEVKSVHVSVKDAKGFTATKKLTDPTSDETTSFADLVPGEYSVSAHALDNEDGPLEEHTVYSASTKVHVAPNSGSATHLFMQDIVPGEDNITVPFIHAINITGVPPVIGVPVRLAADVKGSPAQTYRWNVSCADELAPDAPFSNPTAVATDLTLYRCSTDATITFTVTNRGTTPGQGSLSSSVRFTLPYVPQGAGITGVTLNSWPNITSIGTASNAEPLPGGTIHLVATASDPDGDRLTYAWSDDCGGTFAAGSSLTPTWTAPRSAGTFCELKLTVREAGNEDGHNEGVNSGTFTLRVAPTL